MTQNKLLHADKLLAALLHLPVSKALEPKGNECHFQENQGVSQLDSFMIPA